MGRAGRWAAREARKERRSFVRARGLLFTLVVLGYLLGSATALFFLRWPSRQFRAGALLIGLGWLVFSFLAFDGAQWMREGAEAERWTSGRLKKLASRGTKLFDDIPVVKSNSDRSNVDHVLVGPFGVLAVETKWTDSLPWHIRNGQLEGPLRSNPLGQARNGARRIEEILATRGIRSSVFPVLAVWGPGTKELSSEAVAGVTLLVGRQAKEWAERFPRLDEPLSKESVSAIRKALRLHTASLDPARWRRMLRLSTSSHSLVPPSTGPGRPRSKAEPIGQGQS